MPIKRHLKKVDLSANSIEKKIEEFTNKCELQQEKSPKKEDINNIGMTIKLNKYEHDLLKTISKSRGRSMQKQVKRILITELEKMKS